jgi:hypothetical protein
MEKSNRGLSSGERFIIGGGEIYSLELLLQKN